MTWLYDRAESEGEVIIRYKRAPILYASSLLIFLAMLVAVVAHQLPLALLFCALGFALSMSHRKPNAEVKQAMREGNVQIKGSKWSFTKPLTLTIKKEGIQQQLGQVSSETAVSDEPSS